MIKPYIKIKHPDGSEFQTDVMGLKMLDFDPSSLQFEYATDTVDMGIGSRVLGSKVNERTLKAVFDFYYDNMDSFRRTEMKIAEVFGLTQEVIISESINLWKQYRVRCKPYTIDRGNGVKARLTLEFLLPSGLAESFNVEHDSFTVSNEDIIYTNNGTYEIDQRNDAEMSITIVGATSNPKITNKSTGDVWSYNGSTVVGDKLELKNYTTYKNGVNVLDKTNKAVITFKPGRNVLSITGANNAQLIINSRNYFK
ncbi:phage tail domain-containing protein [Lysinibacillus sp. RS5]|uniref:phage tail domain-containing protein n=1 Tax=unclassified Lysinibacillus TaxID=2636778 RepID=UPI0035BE92F8